MADISSIVVVNISIDSPVSDGASFSNILLVTPVGTGTGYTDACYPITSASDLLAKGYTSTDPVYNAATVAFAQDQAARPNRVFVVGYGSTEEVTDALDRAEAYGGWYGVCPVGIVGVGGDGASESDIENDRRAKLNSIATWVETKDKICGIAFTTADAPISFATFNRTFGIYSGSTEEENEMNEFAAVAWMGHCFGYEPGSETWSLKSLNLISPSNLSNEQVTAFQTAGINYYQTVANANVTIDGYMGSGEWIDIIRFRDWLKNAIQISAFNYLKVNRKVAYTNAGITGMQNVIMRVLKEGQNVGGIDENQYDSEGNVTPGYTVTVPKAGDIPDSVKKSRKLYDVRFTARLTGAIHAVEIRGQLVY